MLSLDITVAIGIASNNKASDWIILGIGGFCWVLILLIELFLIAKFYQKIACTCIKKDTKRAVLISLLCFHVSMTLDIYGDLFIENERWNNYSNILAIVLWGIGSFVADVSFVLKIGAFDKNSISKWACQYINEYTISANIMKQHLKKYGKKLLYTSFFGLLLQMLIVLSSLLYSCNILSFKISAIAILILLVFNCVVAAYLIILLILIAQVLSQDIKFQHTAYRPEYQGRVTYAIDKVVRQTILSLFSFIATIAWFIMAIYLAINWITEQITHNQDTYVNFEKYLSFLLFIQSLINGICLFLQFEFNTTNRIYNICCCFYCRQCIIESRMGMTNKSDMDLLKNKYEKQVPNYGSTPSSGNDKSLITTYNSSSRAISPTCSNVNNNNNNSNNNNNNNNNNNGDNNNKTNRNDEMNDRMDDEKQAIKRRDEILATFFRDLGLHEDNDNNIG